MRIPFASLSLSLALGAAALAAGCGPGRTAAATQPTPKTFDVAASDPAAVAIIDQVIATAGGEAAWAKAKELHWIHAVIVDGKIAYLVKHDWDRWNGRHRMAKYLEGGAENVVQYDLYEGTGNAFVQPVDQPAQPLGRAEIRNMMAEGKERLWADSYMLVLPFKLKDPGVKLQHKGERADESAPAVPKWDIIRVTFDPGVAGTPTDIYELAVNKETHMIDVLDKILVEAGQEKAIGYKLDGWTDVSGIKIATRWLNIGYGKDSPMQPIEIPEYWQGALPPGATAPVPGELVFLLMPTIDAEPDDDLYIPIVTH